MSISHVARGASAGVASSPLTTIGSLTAAAGSSVLVAVNVTLSTDATVAPNGMTWNGVPMTPRVAREFNLDLETAMPLNGLYLYGLDSVAAATGPVVMDVTDALGYGDVPYRYVFIEVAADTVSNVDQVASADGSGSAPLSGNTGATSAATEVLLGIVARSGAVAGSWNAGFIAGQSAASGGGSIEEAYRNVSAIGAYSAGKTGGIGSAWAAAILTFAEGAAVVLPVPRTIALVVGQSCEQLVTVPSVDLAVGVSSEMDLPAAPELTLVNGLGCELAVQSE